MLRSCSLYRQTSLYTTGGRLLTRAARKGLHVQSVQVSRNGWLGLAAGLAAATLGFYLWRGRVHEPPKPAAAALPASARQLLLPFRKNSLDLSVPAHEELDYRVGMQAGATLVFA